MSVLPMQRTFSSAMDACFRLVTSASQPERRRSLRDRKCRLWLIALIDIDDLQRIQDECGNAAGDAVLRVGRQLSDALPANAIWVLGRQVLVRHSAAVRDFRVGVDDRIRYRRGLDTLIATHAL